MAKSTQTENPQALAYHPLEVHKTQNRLQHYVVYAF